MNYKCFLALLSLMCFVLQIRAWQWLDKSILTQALEEVQFGEFTFHGYHFEGNQNESFRLKICDDATKSPYPMFESGKKVTSTVVVDLIINVTSSRLRNAKVTVRAFHCGTKDSSAFYYGQGPSKKSIAVYIIDPNIDITDAESFAVPRGVMTYLLG